MKKKLINECHIEGYVYDTKKLALKETGPKSKNPGTPYISGELRVQTDDQGLNIVSVFYSYVTEKTSKNETNATFTVLKGIIDGTIGTVMKDGVENAGIVKIDTSIALNEFPSNRSGKEEMVVVKRNEGGFIHQISANDLISNISKRATFKADMVITSCLRKEADDERKIPEKVIVKGAIFDFRKALLPVEFSATNPSAMDYFESLEASPRNPVFTNVWGSQISSTVTRMEEVHSAFGETEVNEVKSTYKDFVITGALPEPYVWDSEDTLLASELAEAVAAREVHLAEVKQRNDEWQASRNNAIPNAAPVANSVTAPAAGVYNF